MKLRTETESHVNNDQKSPLIGPRTPIYVVPFCGAFSSFYRACVPNYLCIIYFLVMVEFDPILPYYSNKMQKKNVNVKQRKNNVKPYQVLQLHTSYVTS